MTPEFLFAVAALFHMEGFESNHPLDPGGPTILGFTKKWYPDWYAKLAAAKTREEQLCIARLAYWKEFWVPLRCDEIGDKHVAFEWFEFNVNCPSAARAVREQICTTLKRGSLKECVETYGTLPVVVAFNYFQFYYYFTMRSSDFFAGWVRKRCFDWVPGILSEIVEAHPFWIPVLLGKIAA